MLSFSNSTAMLNHMLRKVVEEPIMSTKTIAIASGAIISLCFCYGVIKKATAYRNRGVDAFREQVKIQLADVENLRVSVDKRRQEIAAREASANIHRQRLLADDAEVREGLIGLYGVVPDRERLLPEYTPGMFRQELKNASLERLQRISGIITAKGKVLRQERGELYQRGEEVNQALARIEVDQDVAINMLRAERARLAAIAVEQPRLGV